MEGKTLAITGATSGIGEVAALALAGRGARIVFTARDEARASATLAGIRAVNGQADHHVIMADLSRLADMKRVGAELAALPRLDVLINNAGALFGRRRETEDGLEMTFALNHMAYFVITNLVLPRLAAGARIISVASGAHARAKLDFDDLQSRHGYHGFGVYSKSKLCNILFNRALAARVPPRVTANCLHPGFVATRFGSQSSGWMGMGLGLAKSVGAIAPEEGAKTIVYLASSPEVDGTSGKYFHRCRVKGPSQAAQSDADAERLWDISTGLAGRGP
jgi:NAD(P)-dependent dehydrogenase (short-subunit alcohol dehydrogenase family)